MISGVLSQDFLPLPMVRWGTQARYKCRTCTAYMGKPDADGFIVCRRCKSVYEPYGPDIYVLVVSDDHAS